MGAMGKSAQFLLHTWLPDAMEGPTPVSALIHAATMVTAGVFMVARLSPLFELAPNALAVVTLRRRHHGVLRRHRRPRAERHQARGRLFDLLAARLHVRRDGRRRLFGRHVPPVHPRLLQGAAVPRLRLGDPRDAPRAGHAATWAGCATRCRSPTVMHADRHARAHRLPAHRRLLSPRTRSSRRPSRATIRSPLYAFVMTVDRRAADLVLFLAADLHDLPRRSRTTITHYEHAHESPLVMLVPLVVLAAGSILAGYPFKEFFAGHRRRGILPRVAEVRRRTTTSCTTCTTCRWSVAVLPTVMMASASRSPAGSISAGPTSRTSSRAQHDAAVPLPAQQVVLRRDLRFLFVRPALWLGRLLWKRGDGGDRRLRPGRRLGARARRHPQRRAAADRLSLSLCLRHADRHRGAHHLVHVRRGAR